MSVLLAFGIINLSDTLMYQPPSGQIASITSIRILNNVASSYTIKYSIKSGNNTTPIFISSLDAGDIVNDNTSYELNSNMSIIGQTNVSGSVFYFINGEVK